MVYRLTETKGNKGGGRQTVFRNIDNKGQMVYRNKEYGEESQNCQS